MTEDDARGWIAERYSPDDISKLDRFQHLLIEETARQNLIAPSTLSQIWTRHFLDSAQLLDHAPCDWTHWVDIGSGAGLPGLVVAMLSGKAVTLIEPRRLRAEFLTSCIADLALGAVTVVQAKSEHADIASVADVISARAVAKLDALFVASSRFALRSTTYILPKGESAKSEVAVAQRSWQGKFHVKHSIVDPKSGIVVATGVAPR